MTEPVAPTALRRHVALIGLSGSGKSTVAPLLASRLGCTPSIDLDEDVEGRLGASAAEIFAERGEEVFRAAESQALADALALAPTVIATGGGVVLSARNRELLRDGATCVWLKARPAQLRARLERSTQARPLLDGDEEFALDRLASEREALYAAAADRVVEVEGCDPMTVSELVREAITGLVE